MARGRDPIMSLTLFALLLWSTTLATPISSETQFRSLNSSTIGHSLDASNITLNYTWSRSAGTSGSATLSPASISSTHRNSHDLEVAANYTSSASVLEQTPSALFKNASSGRYTAANVSSSLPASLASSPTKHPAYKLSGNGSAALNSTSTSILSVVHNITAAPNAIPTISLGAAGSYQTQSTSSVAWNRTANAHNKTSSHGVNIPQATVQNLSDHSVHDILEYSSIKTPVRLFNNNTLSSNISSKYNSTLGNPINQTSDIHSDDHMVNLGPERPLTNDSVNALSNHSIAAFDNQLLDEPYVPANRTVHPKAIRSQFMQILNEPDGQDDFEDEDYFAFTEENRERSEVNKWYALWTIVRASDSRFSGQAYGEWKLFALDFLRTADYFCTLDSSQCTFLLHWSEIKAIWPNEGRNYIRRIYFVRYMQYLTHQSITAAKEGMTVTQLSMIELVPEIVQKFTKQVDASAKQKCQNIHKAIEFAVQTTVDLLVAMATAYFGGMQDAGMFLKFIETEVPLLKAATWDQETERWIEYGLNKKLRIVPVQPDGKNPSKGLYFDPGAPIMANLMFQMKHQVTNTVNSASVAPEGEVVPALSPQRKTHLAVHKGTDELCSDFEGDQEDMNEKNKDRLLSILSEEYERSINLIYDGFKSLSTGAMSEPGMPSAFAIYIGTHKFVGEGSVESGMIYGKESSRKRLEAYLKHMIGFVIGQDMNMINCMHVKDAQNQCHKKPKKPEWMVKYRASQFCPKDDDPTLICEIVRWYPAVKHSHLIPFPGLYSFETFAMGRFKFNRTEMFKEAYQYYEKYHNNFDFPWGEWEADGMKGPTFGVPVCKNDHLYLHDMNPKTKEEKKKHSSQIGIGSMCGDSRGNETHLVFDAMNLAPGSELYQQHDKTDLIRHDNELYREHLPRNIDEYNLPPVENYLALGEAGVRYPESRDYHGFGGLGNMYKPKAEIDQDYQLIFNRTKDLTDEEANLVFCENQGHWHTIFDRQTWKHELTNSWKVHDNHSRKCKGWLKKYYKKMKQKQRKERQQKLAEEKKRTSEEDALRKKIKKQAEKDAKRAEQEAKAKKKEADRRAKEEKEEAKRKEKEQTLVGNAKELERKQKEYVAKWLYTWMLEPIIRAGH